MQIGIFAKTFGGDIEENMAAVAQANIAAVQYNLSIAGLDTVPESAPDDIVDRIATAAAEHDVELAAISGTFNAAHPDPEVRRAAIARFPVLANAAARLGIRVVTLSSGSRDPDDMWRHHPDNTTTEAWADSRDTLRSLAKIAEDAGVDIAIEPEHTNVVSTAALGRRMHNEVGSARLKFVFDAANLLDTDDLSAATMASVIDASLNELGADIALAHAKELVPGRAAVAPGEGALPWDHIVNGLSRIGYTGALVVHGLPESSVGIATRTLRPLVDGVV